MIDVLSQVGFRHPWLLGLIVPVLLLFYYIVREKLFEETSLDIGNAISNTSLKWIERSLWLPDFLKALALCLLIVALARPQKALHQEEVKGEGIDIILALDISSSMLARDFDPDRMAVSKLVAREFIQNRPHDRIGLTLYAADAFTQCAPTTDHKILLDYLDNIYIGMLKPGTAIGMGLSTALSRLKQSEATSKIVILLTDGENNTGYIDPSTAADLAKTMGVKVYTIGVGSDGTVIGAVSRDFRGNIIYGPMQTNIDETLLQDIAERTGGIYFRAKNENNLREIYEKIDRLEKSTIEVTVYHRYKEWYRYPLYLGIILLLLSFLLDALVYNWMKKV